MESSINCYILSTATTAWLPLIEQDIDCTGLYWMPLRRDENGRPLTFLAKFEPGAIYPYHNHPAGEEIYVLAGSCEIEGAILKAGDYLYTPAGYKHSVKTDEGCTLFFMVPEEVEIIR